MNKYFDVIRNRLQKSIERDRRFEQPIEAISWKLWPYSESKLLVYVSIMAILDYISTFIALELSGNNFVFEAGLLAGWALRTGGFPGLFIVDMLAIICLICLAFGMRYIYTRIGFKGFGRAAFIFILVPYFLTIMGVVTNNILVSFL